MQFMQLKRQHLYLCCLNMFTDSAVEKQVNFFIKASARQSWNLSGCRGTLLPGNTNSLRKRNPRNLISFQRTEVVWKHTLLHVHGWWGRCPAVSPDAYMHAGNNITNSIFKHKFCFKIIAPLSAKVVLKQNISPYHQLCSPVSSYRNKLADWPSNQVKYGGGGGARN